jgi:hypothetical protein
VIGRVVLAAVAEEVLVDGHPDISLLRPMARLGRDEWSEIGAVRSLSRVRYRDWAEREGRGGPSTSREGS